jgi:hypothetical protein
MRNGPAVVPPLTSSVVPVAFSVVNAPVFGVVEPMAAGAAKLMRALATVPLLTRLASWLSTKFFTQRLPLPVDSRCS